MKIKIAAIALSLFSLTAQAGLNKWVDADGKVHYSDTLPPENVKTESVRNVAGKGREADPSTSASPKGPQSYAEREAELKKAKQAKEDAAAKKAKQDAAAAAKKQNCTTAQQYLRSLQEGTRIVTYDEKGEKTFLDDDTRAQRLSQAQQSVKDYCN